MIQFPFWIQVVMGVSYVLAQLATTAFVLFVLWPSIRNQERRARRMEVWFEKYGVEKAFWKVVEKISGADGLTGKPVSRADFTENAGSQKGTDGL